MAQPVDPFIPISGRPIRFQQRSTPKPAPRASNGKFGGDIRSPSNPPTTLTKQLPPEPPPDAHRQPDTSSTPRTAHRTLPQRVQLQPTSRPRSERRWLYYLKLLAACIAMLVVGSLAQVAVAGEILIGIYAVWAFIKRIPSRTTFLLALGTFAAIAGLLIVRPDQVLMKNFATYAFLFLFVGVISLAREARD